MLSVIVPVSGKKGQAHGGELCCFPFFSCARFLGCAGVGFCDDDQHRNCSQTNPVLTAGLEVQTESDGYAVQINKERGDDFEDI